MALPDRCPLCLYSREHQSVVTSHVCGAKDHTSAFFHCSNCDVRYQYPGLTPDQESRFYAAEFEDFMAGRSGISGGWQAAQSHIQANEKTYIRRMKYLAAFLSEKKKILEIGCSSGFMLLPLMQSGHDCSGIEPSGIFSEHVKSYGLSVHKSLDHLREDCLSTRFDLILHFFVLEHISFPQKFLEDQLALLNPGGKIIFEIPNAADPLYSLYDIPAFERFYWSLAHPWYFSEASLHYLLDQIDRPYKILREQRYDFSNHIVWSRDGRPGGLERFSKTLGHELDEVYKNALIKSGNCDTLIGIISND